MNVRFRVTLTTEERDCFTASYWLEKARPDFARIGSWRNGRHDRAKHLGRNVYRFRTKRRFVEEGLEAALSELPRPGTDRKLAQKEEARLVATACSTPPAGRARWTLALLAGEMVRLTHKSLSSETIRRR